MRCLVTGGGGFVGANLARRLLRDGHEVHLLLRGKEGLWRLVDVLDQLIIHVVDLGQEGLDKIIKPVQPQWVFHLAAHGAYSWQTDLDQMVRTNFQGTVNLLRACLASGFESFVNTGSSSEYGYKDHAPKETECPEPNSHYAVTKVAATLFCQHIARSEKAPILTLRLYSIYGPYEDPNRLMPTLISRGLKGELPPLVGPQTARDYVFVGDTVEALLLAAQAARINSGKIYNLGTGVQTTLQQVVDVARRVLAIPTEPVWGSMPQRQWDTNCWVADSHLIRHELGWSPRYSFETGFREMVNWHRSFHTSTE
jgi:nucleoside-diphosphate-sugar epimerase